ncbi:MAG: hypothetical protein KDJ12_00965 [Hyphomicrobiales bacterium]|nr:hypothetical protein [Hyphomicrobiales bacterium]
MTIEAQDESTALSPATALAQRHQISRALRRAAVQARKPPTLFVSGGLGFRGRRGERAFRIGLIVSFIAVVILPFLGESIYWGLIASDQYATQIRFAVRSNDAPTLPGVSGIPGTGASSESQDSEIVVNFIESRAMVETLDKTIHLRDMFGRSNADYFSRFDPADPIEALVKYWKKRVTVEVESTSGIVSVTVRSFTPEDSEKIAATILDLSEKLVNDLSARERRDRLALATQELQRAEKVLKEQTANLRNVRNAQGVLDATASADALNAIVGALQLSLTQTQQDIAAFGAAQSTSPAARILRAKADSLRTQIEDYSKRIASAGQTTDGPSMANRADQLSRASIELDLAKQQFAAASNQYQSARTTLETQSNYLVPFLRPSLAEKSTYPHRWVEWIIVVAPLTIGWALLVALALLIRDNVAK